MRGPSRRGQRGKLGRRSARFTLGARGPLLEGTLVSITYGERMKVCHIIVNASLNRLIMRGLRRNSGLLYAALMGGFNDFERNQSVTLTAWHAAMTAFRDKRAHGVAKRFWGWVLWGHADGRGQLSDL